MPQLSQTDLEAQQQPASRPYAPTFATDVPGPVDTRVGDVKANVFVVATFPDAKPLNAIEFIASDAIPLDPLLIQVYASAVTYQVPPARSALVRTWALDISWATPIDAPDVLILTNLFGQPLWTGTLTFFVDGVAQPGLTEIPISQAVFGTVTDDCYLTAGPNSIVTALIKTPQTISIIGRATLELSGTLLIPISNTPTDEPANQHPVPVQT